MASSCNQGETDGKIQVLYPDGARTERNHRNNPFLSISASGSKAIAVIKVYGGDMDAKGNMSCIKQKGKDDMPYLQCKKVVDLDVKGRISKDALKPNTYYEGMFHLGLDSANASQWTNSDPVTIKVNDPRDQALASDKYKLGNENLKLYTGRFKTPSKLTGDFTFTLNHRSTAEKEGLTIKYFALNEIQG